MDTGAAPPEIAASTGASPIEVNSIFVTPAPWIRDDMVPALIRSEIPVYILNGYELIPRACRKFPGGILYIYAERSMGNERLDWPRLFGEWEGLFAECRITVVFLDRGLNQARQKDLRRPKFSVAFIELNQTLRNIQNMIYGIATTLNQKSRRKAIRVSCEKTGQVPEYNVLVGGAALRGQVRDISSSGMAAYLPADTVAMVGEGMELRSLQLTLRGNRILVNAQLMAVREIEGRKVMIVLFKWNDDMRSKERIHQYITVQLQEVMNQEFR